jgi:flagellar basal-body rod protein FlgB
MTVSNLPLFSMLRTRMHWHQERQKLLAENVANADTPFFEPKDLAPLDAGSSAVPAVAPLKLARTDPGHIGGGSLGGTQFAGARGQVFEKRPRGNAVNLEDEMMKVAANQMDYQAATTLYGRSLGLIKTAIGRR